MLAVIKLDGVEIGEGLTETTRLSFKIDAEEHYGFNDGGKPKVVDGNQHVTGELEKVWLDNTHGQQVLARTRVDIDLYPLGTASGKPKVTVKQALLHDWDLDIDRAAIVLESVAFTGEDLEFGTA